tara:strand:- start:131 stop:766 length:636 start_codon:yes stop_codon:yes gene_type:complete
MTGQEIITKFNNMVQDSIDADFALQLANDAKTLIEEEATWEVLKKEQTFTIVGGSDETTAYTLPSDFGEQVCLTDKNEYLIDLIAFQDRYSRKHCYKRYYIDYADQKFYISGTNQTGEDITLVYKKVSDDIELTTSWVFPSRFHSLIPYKMAMEYYAADAGEKQRAWDDRWAGYYQSLLSSAKNWNAKLQMQGRSTRQYRKQKLANGVYDY